MAGNAKICIPRGRSGKDSRRQEKQRRNIRNGEVKVKVERIERVKGKGIGIKQKNNQGRN